ncbi:benzoate transporter [Erwinia tracheiphila PSU-1]|nr:benzoate transporter [Erwinia tracheiphila PSU-1]
MRPPFSHLTLPALVAGFVAVLVGYASSAAIVFQAASAAGTSELQVAGWLSMPGLAMGLTSVGLLLYYRAPVLTAWSTPGAALLVTTLTCTSLADAIGMFVFTSALIFLSGVTGLFARLMCFIPQAMSSAILAGILLHFDTEALTSLPVDFSLTAGMSLIYLAAKRFLPLYAILIALVTGLTVVMLRGDIYLAQQTVNSAMLTFVAPHFNLARLADTDLSFFVVTMASQNSPGIVALRAGGFQVSDSPLIGWTGLTSLLLTPFGGFSVCIAAITSAICMGHDVHPDPQRRY